MNVKFQMKDIVMTTYVTPAKKKSKAIELHDDSNHTIDGERIKLKKKFSLV